MKTREMRIAICPKCGKEYQGSPALSRVDNKTYICPDCGTRDEKEQEEILATIHSHTR